LAIEYAYSFRNLRPTGSVIWLASRGFWRLSQSIKATARRLSTLPLGIHNVPTLINWLQEKFCGAWLLILDDLSFEKFPDREQNLLIETVTRLEAPSGQVLITTKPSNWMEIASFSNSGLILVSKFSCEESLTFVDLKASKSTLPGPKKSCLVEILDHVPSALNLALSYWLENCDTERGATMLQEFISEETNQAGGLHEKAVLPARRSLLRLIMSQLREESQLALNILYLMSVLDIQGVPLTLLTLCCNQSHEGWRYGFHRAVRKLITLSMIHCSHDQFTLFLDEDIRLCIDEKMKSEGNLILWQENGVEFVAEVFPDGESVYWPQCEDLPHALTALTYHLLISFHAVPC